MEASQGMIDHTAAGRFAGPEELSIVVTQRVSIPTGMTAVVPARPVCALARAIHVDRQVGRFVGVWISESACPARETDAV